MAGTPASASSYGVVTGSVSHTSAAADTIALPSTATSMSSKRLDDSLWWESFVVLLEELESGLSFSELDDNLANKLKRNHAWFLDSVSRFKAPNEASRRALDSNELLLGVHSLVIKPKLREAALRASKLLCLDEVQTYILASRFVGHDKSIDYVEAQDFLQWVLRQYFFERQCLLKCIRLIFVNSFNVGSVSLSNDAIKGEAMQLIHDKLEIKILSVLKDLLLSAPFEKFLQDVELVGLWADETIVEDTLILDILFLVYYDNFCVCNAAQWMSLCSLFKDILGGAYSIENLAISVEASASFNHAKAQLLIILIETLDLENLLRMVHDEVPFREGGSIFSLQDVLEIDFLVSTFSRLGTFESGPLYLAWAVFICLLSSLPDIKNQNILTEIDHVDYARQAFEVGTFNYLLEVLRSDCLRYSDGPISGFLNILRTFISAFIASYELNHQPEENLLRLILDVLCEIYKGEESLSIQFWDRDSFVDGPIRSLLYMLESEYPYHITELLHLLSSLCSGSWSAECVFNFLEKMNGMTGLYKSPTESALMDVYDVVEAEQRIPISGVEGVFIPPGTRGQILKIVGVNIALARWECTHSGIYLLALRVASHPNGHDEVKLILNLLNRLLSSNPALCFNLLHLDESLYTQAARNSGLIEQNMCIDIVRVISSLTVRFIEDGGHASTVAICLNIFGQMIKCAPSHVIGMVLSSNIFGTPNINSSSDAWLLSGGFSRMLLDGQEEENGCFLLTTSVLDLTVQLIKKGTWDNLVSALVVFALRYIFVNHMHKQYKLKSGHWKVILKVLNVMKSCVNGARGSHMPGHLIRDILYFDSSILSSLCRLLYISEQGLEKSSLSACYGLKEAEDLQEVSCSVLDILYYLLGHLSKGTLSASLPFIQILLPSSSKPASVFNTAVSLVTLFSNEVVQVAATKFLSMLCVIASRLQPFSLGSITLANDLQIGNLTAAICRILEEEPCKRKDFLISVLELLFSAACFQPSFFLPIISSHVEEEGSDFRNKFVQAPLVNQINSRRKSAIDLVLKYVDRSELLISSDPRLLMSTLNFLKSLWDGGVLYMDTLEKVRKSSSFWEHLSSILASGLSFDHCIKDLSDDDIQHDRYRYGCQGIVLEIMARELLLLDKEYQNEIYGTEASSNNSTKIDKNRLIFEASQSSVKFLQNGVLSNWNEGSVMDTLVKSYSSGGYDTQIVSHAKLAACVLIVHLMRTLLDGKAECLSVPLVGMIHMIKDKLLQNPSFSALLEQYSFQGYSDGKEVSRLVLHDLYHHLLGEMEGRLIAPGHFQELSGFLLNLEIFQCKESMNEKDLWGTDVMMYDIPNIRAELGFDLWDKSEWKVAKEFGEKMLSHMHAANLMISLADSKSFSLKALISIILLHHGMVRKSKSKITSNGISDTFIDRSIIHICRCIHSTEKSLFQLLNPSEKLLELLTTQAEMLLVFSRILFMQHSNRNNKQQLFSVSLTLIRTSGSCLKLLATNKLSSMLNNAAKFFLMVLLMSIEFIHDEFALDENLLSEASQSIVGILPLLCKYVEHIEWFDLSVTSMDSILRNFLAPDISLPILHENLPLNLLIEILRRRSSLASITIALNLLLTLAQTKGGAKMLHSINLFASLELLISHLVDENNPNPAGGYFFANYNENDVRAHLLGLAIAIISSICHSLHCDSSVIDIFGRAFNNYFADKSHIISLWLTTPNFLYDVPRTSLAALQLSEHAFLLICLLGGHQDYRQKGLKEIDSELMQKSIHFLAFISKEGQRIGDSCNRTVPLFCFPTLKEESELNEKPSFVSSKHGWFVVSALGVSCKNKVNSSLSTGLSIVNMDQANGCAEAQPTYYSDVVSVQIYRITFFLLTFLCMQAKAATERAEEVGYVDLSHFPDLPMPEILHGLQDQAIAIVVDVCEARSSDFTEETESVCLLMLQILERSLYLEFCVTQSCGIRPVTGRVEDVSREIQSLIQVVKQHGNLQASVASLMQILTLVYPGLIQTSSLL